MIRDSHFPAGETVPALGQGTWMMERDKRPEAMAALRLGVDLGMTLIDTAEMYGDGRVETLVAEAIADIRERVFLVSKVYPQNSTRSGVAKACERSLKRLGTDRLDLYLLHWRGSVPLAETLAGFEDLKRAGKIRHWGVSNFDTTDMEELFSVDGGKACQTNQILYNLSRRGPEFDLSRWQETHGVPVMAYSPFEQGRMKTTGVLNDIGRKHGATGYQVALAWLLQKPNTIVIPKSANADHVRENRAAAEITLSTADLDALDGTYRPPRRKSSLDMI